MDYALIALNNMKIYIYYFLFIPLFSFSQISGVVYDNNQVPIGGVDVFLYDLNLLTQTDNIGVFELEQNITNNSFVQFSKYGYANKVIQYKKDNPIIVVLKKLHVELDEIGIQEKSSVLGNNKTLNIEHKSLKDNHLLSTSLVENLSQLTGVSLIGSGLGIQKIVIRGLSGLRVVSYLNGMQISNQEWANDHGIGFTEVGLESVELIKGASSLKYGGSAVGGIVYFKDAPFKKSNIPSGFIASKFDDSHFLFSNKFGLNWSINNFYINAYGQHRISSDYRLPNNKYLYNSRLRNQSFKLSTAHLGKKLHVILRYQYHAEQQGIPGHAHGDLENIEIESLTLNTLDLSTDLQITRPTQYVTNNLFIIESKYFSNKIKYNFFAGYFKNNLQEFDKWTVPAFDLDLSTTTLRFNLDLPLRNFDINSGIQYQRQVNLNLVEDLISAPHLIPDSDSNEYGLHATINYNKNNFGFNIGTRLDFKEINCDINDYNKLFSAYNASLGLFYQYNSHSARITYSGSYRAPHLSELFSNGLHHGTMRFEIGDVNLDIEKSHQLDFKYQWNNDHIGFVLNPFYQFISDFISINPTDSLYQNIYPIYNYTQFNSVRMSGLELNLHYHPHFLHYLHIEQSFSAVNALNKDNNQYIALSPSNKVKTRFNLDLSSFNLPLGFKSFNIYHLYSFKQENTASYEKQSSAYTVCNIETLINPIENLNLGLGVNNLFNEEYVPHLSRIRDVAGGIPNPGRSFYLSAKYKF